MKKIFNFKNGFDVRHVIFGDTIEADAGNGFGISAMLCQDTGVSPDDYDCYSDRQKARWRNDEWWFGGIILSVTFHGHLLEDHAASLWGLECNLNQRGNRYLTAVANELVEEAMECARQSLDDMLENWQQLKAA